MMDNQDNTAQDLNVNATAAAGVYGGIIAAATAITTVWMGLNGGCTHDEAQAFLASTIKTLTPGDAAPANVQAGPKLSAAEIRKSITPDALISFIDGKPYKTLKRHLTTHGLDPAGYRAKYGLPADYPIVSEKYSAARSELARTLGLGQSRKGTDKADTAAAETTASPEAGKKLAGPRNKPKAGKAAAKPAKTAEQAANEAAREADAAVFEEPTRDTSDSQVEETAAA